MTTKQMNYKEFNSLRDVPHCNWYTVKILYCAIFIYILLTCTRLKQYPCLN